MSTQPKKKPPSDGPDENPKKNRGFVQFYENHLPHVRELITSNPVAAALFVFLTEKMDNRNALVCSTQVLCEVFEKSRATMERAIKYLRDHNYVFITKAGQTNVFHLNSRIVWKAWNSDKQYAEFHGMVLISKRENQDIDLEWQRMKHLKSVDPKAKS